jgi:esterase/lipase superfamily enzyme
MDNPLVQVPRGLGPATVLRSLAIGRQALPCGRCRNWVFMLARLTAILCAAVVLGGLGGCTARPSREVLEPVVQAPRYTAKVDILVATTRGITQPGNPKTFANNLSPTINYAALTMSIPRSHKAGEIEYPGPGTPDLALQMAVTEHDSLDRASFLQSIQRNVAAGGPEAGSVLVFTHGYNTKYEEAVYRFAQIIHDSGFTGTAVLFAWPSRGNTALYLADRDASTYSRDYFEATLRDIASLRSVKEINILAHSMGNWLTVETLRQAKLKGKADFNGKLGDVILASPDIDNNVFRTQLDVIGKLKRPITVFVSGDDSALQASALLAGGQQRAGQVTGGDLRTSDAAKRYNLRIIDLSSVDGGDAGNHSKFAQAGVVRVIGQNLASDAAGAKNQPGVITAVQDVGKSLLNLPGTILGAPVLLIP